MQTNQTRKRVLVTGGNTGIGAALCKQLVAEDNCFCYMGSRSLTKGQSAVNEILSQYPDCKQFIKVVELDVSD